MKRERYLDSSNSISWNAGEFKWNFHLVRNDGSQILAERCRQLFNRYRFLRLKLNQTSRRLRIRTDRGYSPTSLVGSVL